MGTVFNVNIQSNRIHSLKYQRSTNLTCKDKGLDNLSLKQKLSLILDQWMVLSG